MFNIDNTMKCLKTYAKRFKNVLAFLLKMSKVSLVVMLFGKCFSPYIFGFYLIMVN